jgi:hypothetical protein
MDKGELRSWILSVCSLIGYGYIFAASVLEWDLSPAQAALGVLVALYWPIERWGSR